MATPHFVAPVTSPPAQVPPRAWVRAPSRRAGVNQVVSGEHYESSARVCLWVWPVGVNLSTLISLRLPLNNLILNRECAPENALQGLPCYKKIGDGEDSGLPGAGGAGATASAVRLRLRGGPDWLGPYDGAAAAAGTATWYMAHAYARMYGFICLYHLKRLINETCPIGRPLSPSGVRG